MIALLLASALCGTSPEAHQRALDLHRWVRAAAPRVVAHALDAAPTTRFANDVVYMRADEETVPFDDPADLEGLSLHFTRRNESAFAVTRTPLQYDDDIGPLFVAFGRGVETKALPLTRFAFPFGNASHNALTLSVVRGIHFEAEAILPRQSFDALETAMARAPLLAPLLDYVDSPAGRPDVFVKETDSAITITWRSQAFASAKFDLQAMLFANGDVRFSYRTVRNINWGGAVVTTGTDAWLAQKTPLLSATDPAGDVDPQYGDVRDMLDLRSVEISRIAGTSLLELRIRVAAPIDVAKLQDGSSYLMFIGDSMNRVELTIHLKKLVYRLPNVPEVDDSNAAHIDGTDIVMYVSEEHLAVKDRAVPLYVYANSLAAADSLTTTLHLGSKGSAMETDFSALDGIETARPLVETYRLGTVNVHGVWARLAEELGYREEEIDAVAIYTDFLSDIILTRYGAYATIANPGADGISASSSKSAPRTPTLMHMNALTAFSGESATQILMHELGHRWLYYFEIRENGETRRTLNPISPHPAAWVHTPAAFSIHDSSAMGGTWFTDNGDGTFTTSSMTRYSAYSWHELYLMGLARPEEVPPWFYIHGTSLPDEYFPGPGATVSGTRVDVGMQQILDAMGARDPGFDASPKEFRVLFVVLERAPAKLDASVRADFETAFAKATGNRGALNTNVSLAAPVASFVHANGAFTDTSAQQPLAWDWNFGDGTTSQARNPHHVYAQRGTYVVTLTVRNGKGSSTATQTVTVAGPKRRAVRQ